MAKLVKCDFCPTKDKLKFLKRIKGKKYCKKCASDLRKRHREETIRRAGIADELRQLKNRSRRELRAKRNPPRPKIIPIKKTPKYNKLGLFLSKQERQILYRKFLNEGLTEDKADARVKKVDKEIQKVIMKMRQKKKAEKDIAIRFKEEFEKLIKK
jgi:hypothetical protein